MKIALAVLALFASVHANAVRVAECPEHFSIEYKTFVPATDAQLQQEYGWIEDLQIQRDEFARNWKDDTRVNFKLTGTKSGKCDYTTQFETAMYDSRLYSKSGRDILRLDAQIGETGVWIYHNVEEYGQDRLLIQNIRQVNVYAGCQTGGCLDKIGTLIIK